MNLFKSTLLSASLIAGLSLTACSDDTDVVDANSLSDKELTLQAATAVYVDRNVLGYGRRRYRTL